MKIGVLGGGQLGRMLALAGYPLGLTFRFLDPAPDAPAGQVAELITGRFDDASTLDRFARGLDAVTFEFENVPVGAVRFLESLGGGRSRVFPSSGALEVAQDRLAEKTLFSKLGIPTPSYEPVSNPEQLLAAVARIGLPAVLKTRRMGYDGKGQLLLQRPEDLAGACESLQNGGAYTQVGAGGGAGGGAGVPPAAEVGRPDLILEEFIPFDREVSIIAVRSASAEEAFYPLIQNIHRDGILRISRAPAHGLADLQAQARRHAAAIVESLGYVGVLAIEFFERNGILLGNEIAPRVHNSGHWTIEGARTSQFENHLRAILGWPLGETRAIGHSAMVNLIGTIPEPARVLAVRGAHPHLYGKQPHKGRKLGHITICRDTEPEVEEGLRAIEMMQETRGKTEKTKTREDS